MKFTRKEICEQRDRRIPYRGMIAMHPSESGVRVNGEIWDLSMGGMFIKTFLPLKAGTVFEVEIPMQPESYRGSVRVLWKRLREASPDEPFGMAVEWVGMTDDQKKLLFRRVSEHLGDGGDLLVGTPEVEITRRPPKQAAKPPATAESRSRARLLLGLTIALVALLVVMVALLYR